MVEDKTVPGYLEWCHYCEVSRKIYCKQTADGVFQYGPNDPINPTYRRDIRRIEECRFLPNKVKK